MTIEQITLNTVIYGVNYTDAVSNSCWLAKLLNCIIKIYKYAIICIPSYRSSSYTFRVIDDTTTLICDWFETLDKTCVIQ